MEQGAWITLGFIFYIIAVWAWFTGTAKYLMQHGYTRTGFLNVWVLAPLIDVFKAAIIKLEKQDQLPIGFYLHAAGLTAALAIWAMAGLKQ